MENIANGGPGIASPPYGIGLTKPAREVQLPPRLSITAEAGSDGACTPTPKLQHDPEAVTTYATQPVPDRKPYTSKPTVQDKAFHKELEQMRADAEAGVIHTPNHEPQGGGVPSLKLDDYPDL